MHECYFCCGKNIFCFVQLWRKWLGNNASCFVHRWETWLGNNVSWFVNLWKTYWETMFPGLPTFGKHGYDRKQCFPVCPPLGNMTRKQCFLVCPLLRNMVCPPLGNMTRKQLPAKPFSSLPQVLVYIGVPSWTYTRGFG